MAEAWIELPNGDKYPGEGAGIIHEWTEYVCTILVIHPSEAEKIAAAVRVLGERAQAQYPELESGGIVTLHLSQTEGLLDGLAFEFADRLVGMTGAALLMSQDGPKVGADLLAEQVEYLRDAVWPKGGSDADDGHT